ncbi:MAG: fumarylacetoacetate hydrolase family protein [Clostridia bacterium]|nr:fumarylacetoacetate hydrolase family protein [Clostridia bacterium]MCL6520929.1 fumarylacetoacetate hydrolase family protein [Bacillota bacterium]
MTERLVRLALPDGRVAYGRRQDDVIELLGGAPWTVWGKPTGERVEAATARLLAPVQPGKVVAVGLNYRMHAEEMKDRLPDEPVLFLKPASSVIGPGEPIRWPAMSREVHYEAELAVVIGRRARNLEPDEVEGAILGYTCGNDVTARDLQRKDGQWTRSKSFDTFCPLGPEVVRGIDPSGRGIRTLVNGEVRQEGNTGDLLFDVAYLVRFVSQVMTLEPGDVILTGTPAGVGPVRPGDEVRVVIDGLGELVNPVE